MSGKSGMFDIKGAVSIAEAALFPFVSFPLCGRNRMLRKNGCVYRNHSFSSFITSSFSFSGSVEMRARWLPPG